MIEEGYEEMDQSFKGYSAKIRDLELALGILPDVDGVNSSSVQGLDAAAAPEKSSSAVALYDAAGERGKRMLAPRGSVGSMSVGELKYRDREDAKTKEQ